MTSFKTTSGLMRAVANMTAELNAVKIDNKEDHDAMSRRMDSLLGQLNVLWSNPADADEAAKAKGKLVDAWYDATH